MSSQEHADEVVEDLGRQVVELVRQRGLERRDVPFKLASGQLSNYYIDGKFVVDNGHTLMLVCRAAIQAARQMGIAFDAVGGLTMGADALSHGIAIATGCTWFTVRKEPKSRGREQWIEGGRISPGTRVLLIDDVVTTGGSIMKAYQRVTSTAAVVVGVVTLVDRGETGKATFKQLGIPYIALVTYRDLGIDPVDGSPIVPTSH